jgi:hypothetical protein
MADEHQEDLDHHRITDRLFADLCLLLAVPELLGSRGWLDVQVQVDPGYGLPVKVPGPGGCKEAGLDARPQECAQLSARPPRIGVLNQAPHGGLERALSREVHVTMGPQPVAIVPTRVMKGVVATVVAVASAVGHPGQIPKYRRTGCPVQSVAKVTKLCDLLGPEQ